MNDEEREAISRVNSLRETVEGQGLSMAAMTRELAEARKEIALWQRGNADLTAVNESLRAEIAQLRAHEQWGISDYISQGNGPDERCMARGCQLRAPPSADATPTDEEISAAIKPIWLAVKPSRRAQEIRSALSVEFDDPKFKDWMANYASEWVWDLVDIAAQRGMVDARKAALEEALLILKRWNVASGRIDNIPADDFYIRDYLERNIRSLIDRTPPTEKPE